MVFTYLENNSAIHLISDVSAPQSSGNTNVNQVNVYKNNVLIGYFTDGGLTLPDEFAKELAFDPTLTTVGNRYIFTVTPQDINQEGPYFEDGVYSFILSDSGNFNLQPIGEVIDREIRCCMGSYLIGKDSNCDYASFKNVNVSSALLEGARASMLIGDVKAATCQFETVESECKGCK
jgi:hypothetical protein